MTSRQDVQAIVAARKPQIRTADDERALAEMWRRYYAAKIVTPAEQHERPDRAQASTPSPPTPTPVVREVRRRHRDVQQDTAPESDSEPEPESESESESEAFAAQGKEQQAEYGPRQKKRAPSRTPTSSARVGERKADKARSSD
ncbi:hypothetical protein AURDEDRAFT_124984 [Auricularia subglabra TFB-10046 SS5]|nr:hypothetical protein AURDEDRAFT_124984 [Auricularia subglabra TFB-10046 SS5]